MASDNTLYSTIRSILLSGLTAQGLPNVLVEQDYQPEQQGAPSASCVFMSRLFDTRHGFSKRSYVDDVGGPGLIETDTQQMETTIQCMARISVQDYDFNAPTAGDLINIASHILQSDQALVQLKAQGIGVLRIRDIRAPYIVNEYDRNELSPSFDITFTHKRSLVWTVPAVDSIEYGIHRV